MKRLIVTKTGIIALAAAVLLTGCVRNYGAASRPYYANSTIPHHNRRTGSHRHHDNHTGSGGHHEHHGDHSHGSGHH